MSTIIMTGATSFLGRNTLSHLLSQGNTIYALVRKDSPKLPLLPDSPNLITIYGDLNDIDIIYNFVKKANYFLHFGWDGSGSLGRADTEMQNKNIAYSIKALKLAEKTNCSKFIFSGSQAEYGKTTEQIFETNKCSPISAYGKAKLEFSEYAFKYTQNKPIEFLHLRIFSVYGYGDRDNTLVDLCVKNFDADTHTQLGCCQQYWNYLYIDDFVFIITKLLNFPTKSGIYNIASKDTRILRDFVEEIYDLSTKTGKYTFSANEQNPEGSPTLQPNIDKLISIIGNFEFKLFSEGIKEIKEKMKG